MGGNAKLIIITSLLWILSGVSTAKMKLRPLENRGDSSFEMNHHHHVPAQSYNTTNPDDRSTAFTVSDLEDEVVVPNSNNNNTINNLT